MCRPHAAPLALVLTTLLLLTPTLASYGQETRPTQANTVVYLPTIETPALASIRFASGVDEPTGEPIDPTTSFSLGLDLMYVVYGIYGMQGRQYRLDFTYADGETLAGETYTVPSSHYQTWDAYCLTRVGSCSAGRDVLPVGPYTARLYIDGNLFAEAQATIR